MDRDLDEIGRRGTKAWNDLKKSKDWGHWMIVGESLQAGRNEAMRAAGTNRPEGRGYNELFSQWIDRYKLAEIPKDVRAHLLQLMEHRSEIEEYRLSLPLGERLRMNHPTVVLRNWRKLNPDPDKKPRRKAQKVNANALQGTIMALEEELEALREPMTFGGFRELAIAQLSHLGDPELIRKEGAEIIEEALRQLEEELAA
jgi:hypothetical protein